MTDMNSRNNSRITNCYNNLYSFWKSLASASSGIVIENENYLFAPLGTSVALLNPVFIFNVPSSQIIELAHELKSKLDKDICLCWRCDNNSQNQQTIDVIKTITSSHRSPVPVMYYDLNQILPTQNKFNVEIWQDNKDLSNFFNPIRIAFNMQRGDAVLYRIALEKNHDKFKHFCVYQDNQIVGTASLYFEGRTTGFYNLAVLPEYRNQGIASALHLQCFQTAKQMKYPSVTLQATPMAISLVQALGYETVSEMDFYW